jgi:hypothetical protein
METAWLRFYRSEGPDSEGRTLEEILGWDDDALETTHDYIQWLFPLPERSAFNPRAPVLTEAEMAAARGDERVQQNLRRAQDRMRVFYRVTPEREHLPKAWACSVDHNHLRITRILRSLRLLGREQEAEALYRDLSRFDAPVDERAKRFWREAVSG